METETLLPHVIAGELPNASEVIAALEWSGFYNVEAWRIVNRGYSALYKVILPGYADVDWGCVRRRIAGAFCEEVTIPAIRTKGTEVHLLLKLNGFESLGELPL